MAVIHFRDHLCLYANQYFMNENEFVVPVYLIMKNYQLYRRPVLLVRPKVSFTEPIMLVGNSSKSRRDVRLI